MVIGVLSGGGLGWLAVEHTLDGSMARYLVDDRTAWLYVAALVGLLCVGALANPRWIAGLAGGLAVGLLVAATATLRPATAAASDGAVDLGPPLAVAAAAALGVALLSTLRPARDRRHRAHDVRRPWSRRARRDRALALQVRH
jgi:hypothetical protein